MDPAVTAALVGIPTAVVTGAVSAVAAFAGARAQARGAHRGPVDAVRRQHQREAYASLVAEVAKYQRHTFRVYLCIIDSVVRSRWNASLTSDDSQTLHFAAAAVRLEGPPHLSEMAHRIELASSQVFGALFDLRHAEQPISSPAHTQFNEHHNTLKDVTNAFVEAASAHLNSTGRRQ